MIFLFKIFEVSKFHSKINWFPGGSQSQVLNKEIWQIVMNDKIYWPTTGKLSTKISGEHNERVFSRAKAKLVIVCNEECVEKFISGEMYTNNYAMKIRVLGMAVCTFTDQFLPPNKGQHSYTSLMWISTFTFLFNVDIQGFEYLDRSFT